MMHVIATEEVCIIVLKHEPENHDGNHQEPHMAKDMTWFECDLVSSRSMSRN
jgi:hypothetical protein